MELRLSDTRSDFLNLNQNYLAPSYFHSHGGLEMKGLSKLPALLAILRENKGQSPRGTHQSPGETKLGPRCPDSVTHAWCQSQSQTLLKRW